MNAPTVKLNADQLQALAQIEAAIKPCGKHLLTGHAGSGKTTLMQTVARRAHERGQSIILTAPTHKAVHVLAKKLNEAGLGDIPSRTIHSLLSLKPRIVSDRQVFSRDKHAPAVMQDIVVIDECSMISEELMVFIKRHLPESFVLFVGDPAQLPPVGEIASPTFDTPSRSHLDTIVRQAEGNPVLHAAAIIRQSQGNAIDWSWCESSKESQSGVFRPRNPDQWMQQAFTSADFNADPDQFRYLCWTNDKVAATNRKIRGWRYGAVDTPFVPGERAMFKAPIFDRMSVIINTNEEAEVISIASAVFQFKVPARGDLNGWTATIPSWSITVRKDDETRVPVHLARDELPFKKAMDRLADEATDNRARWGDRHDFNESMAKMQPIYAMTVHASQGSTFKHVFLDIPDIRRRVESNLLEAQQLYYVGATRPTHALMLVGAA